MTTEQTPHTPSRAGGTGQAFILPRRVRLALLEIRAGLLDDLRADELDDDQARDLRRRGRTRQLRALEKLIGIAPADLKAAGHG